MNHFGIKAPSDLNEKTLVIKILPLLVIVFAALFIITAIVFYIHQKTALKDDLSHKLRSCQRILSEDIEKDAKLLEGLIEPIILNKDIKTALIAKDREGLKQLGLPIFNHINSKYNITHFTFISPDRINIIRLHDINLFGERVNRYTTLEAEKTGRTSYGIELGVLGTFTLRVVTPIYSNNNLIGYIELGMDIFRILQRIKDTLEIEPYALIEKSLLKQQDWEAGMKILGFEGSWNMSPKYVINNVSVRDIPECVIKILLNNILSNQKIYLNVSSNNNRYNIGFFPLSDVSGKEVGLILITDLYTHKIRADIRAFSMAILISLLIVLIILWFFYKVLSSIDKRLRDYNYQRELYESRLKEANAEAKASDRAKTEFLSNMSHEIRTPLNGIIATVELLLNTTLNYEQKELLLIAASSAESLQLLLDTILNLVDMTSGRVTALKKMFNLRDLINSMTQVFFIKAKQKGLRFSYLIGDDVPAELSSIPDLLKQALTHLIDNGIKFTQNGEIQLSIKTDNKTLLFSVIDTGIGIPKDKFEDIFKSFAQVDMSFARMYGGAGLGLAITSKIINILNGKLWVESEIGKGSRFNFVINIEDCNQIDSGLLKDMSILIVDNDIINQAILKEILTSEGAALMTASNGAEALEIIRQRQSSIDAVIMEIRLHDIETTQFIQILKGDIKTKNSKIILIGTDNIVNLEGFNVLSYLEKPIDKTTLINTLLKSEG
jgi:signal transduction histidine kinase